MYTEKQLKRMTRRQIWEVGNDICSERELCAERGGFLSKEVMIASVLAGQSRFAMDREDNVEFD